jgi:ubiquinol-cytochrome c reductase cytochrome b subunit
MMRISFEVPGGLLVRQLHHWSALLLPAAVLLQLVVTFFTGAFRRPRRGMWLLLFGIYVVSLAGGWSGYALPDDMLSGTGLRITEGIILSIPVVGTWLAQLFFAGSFPGAVIENLYPLHVVIVPAVLLVLLVLRGLASWHHKPPQFPGTTRTDDNVVGVPLVPVAASRAFGLFFLVSAMLVLVSATVTVNPIWLYGPASPGDASAGSQPDWYTGFLDGALRLVPPGWEVEIFDRTLTLAMLVPLAVVTVYLLAVAAYPFVEEWFTGDRREHHLLDRPRNTAVRTSIGIAAMTFYAVLWVAGSADLIATHFSVALEQVIALLQVLLVVGPVLGFALTHRICLGLQQKESEVALHGFETGRIVRLPGGEYVEIHGQLDRFAQQKLARPDSYRPLALIANDRGRVPLTQRLRVAVSRFFFEDRISSATPMLNERKESADRPVTTDEHVLS